MDGENMENRKLPGETGKCRFWSKKLEGGGGWMGGLNECPWQFGGIFGIHVTVFICRGVKGRVKVDKLLIDYDLERYEMK